MSLTVQKPGLSTTVQDAGRNGHYDVGIPPSGALDQYSLTAANLLVGNPAGAAALECVYLGPELVFGESAVVAVAGASMVPKVDGEERARHRPGWPGRGGRTVAPHGGRQRPPPRWPGSPASCHRDAPCPLPRQPRYARGSARRAPNRP